MADDAFALSPINARASMPTEADYEAICGAFMETARGRWFLGEYARRNRNADTRLVLDAVERIEATLASQKAAAATPSLADYLPDISDLISDARRRVLGALPKNDMRPTTEPIQRAAGILRDVAWTLRESGSDTRVCDLLDVQAKAIVDGCTRIHDQAAPDVPAAVTAALDSLIRRISALAGAHAPRRIVRPQRSAEPTAETRPDEPVQAPAEPAASPAMKLDVTAPDASPTTTEFRPKAVEIAEPQAKQQGGADQGPEPPQAAAPPTVEVDLQAGLSEGLEIAEIDPDENATEPDAGEQAALPDRPPATIEAEVAEPAPAGLQELSPVADAPHAAAEVAEPEPAVQQPAVVAEPEVRKKPAPSSLGQAALDGGVVTPLRSRYSEALAPIRRMSQAEKIAFFS